MSPQALLIWAYFLLVLPLWVAFEVVHARPGKRPTWWMPALWGVRALALAGVAWLAFGITSSRRPIPGFYSRMHFVLIYTDPV